MGGRFDGCAARRLPATLRPAGERRCCSQVVKLEVLLDGFVVGKSQLLPAKVVLRAAERLLVLILLGPRAVVALALAVLLGRLALVLLGRLALVLLGRALLLT